MPRIRTMPALLALLALAATSAARDARATDCLAGPNAQAPAGSHWYYRLDRATHRKCWYIGAQGARPHRAVTQRRSARPSTDDAADDVPAAAPPTPKAQAALQPTFATRAPTGAPTAIADAAPAPPAAAPAPPLSEVAAALLPERIAPRAVQTTTERARAPEPAKPAPPQPQAEAAPAPAAPTPGLLEPGAARGAMPAALFGMALLLAAVGTMLVLARRRMIRVHHAPPASRRARRTLSDILAQAERGEPDRADAATRFFDRLRLGLDENGEPTVADDEPLLVPPRAANTSDIAAATLQPAIAELPAEPIAPAPDVEQSLRQLLADWERRAA